MKRLNEVFNKYNKLILDNDLFTAKLVKLSDMTEAYGGVNAELLNDVTEFHNEIVSIIKVLESLKTNLSITRRDIKLRLEIDQLPKEYTDRINIVMKTYQDDTTINDTLILNEFIVTLTDASKNFKDAVSFRALFSYMHNTVKGRFGSADNFRLSEAYEDLYDDLENRLKKENNKKGK